MLYVAALSRAATMAASCSMRPSGDMQAIWVVAMVPNEISPSPAV